MWLFRIVLTLLVALLFLYYVTVCVHIVTPIFKKSVDMRFLPIPFYGWIKGL